MKNEKKLDIKNMNQEQLRSYLMESTYSGNLEVVRYLLTSPYLEELHHTNSQVHNDVFLGACFNGQLTIVRYLLTSPELNKHVDIHAYNECALTHCYENTQLEVFKYLLTSPELKEHANIHTNNDFIFKNASSHKDFDLIKYLILDYKIKKTDTIERYLSQNTELHYIEKMFHMRDLDEKLKYSNQKTIKQIKI